MTAYLAKMNHDHRSELVVTVFGVKLGSEIRRVLLGVDAENGDVSRMMTVANIMVPHVDVLDFEAQ